MRFESYRCDFPGCSEFALHTHHITYSPAVTKVLCVRHHEEITILNGQRARGLRHSLSNKHRWWIWFQWRERKLKVRRTKKAMTYVDKWYRGRDQPPTLLLDAPEQEKRTPRGRTEDSGDSDIPKTKRGNRNKKPTVKVGIKRGVRRRKLSSPRQSSRQKARKRTRN
jgi:hypothetical protein